MPRDEIKHYTPVRRHTIDPGAELVRMAKTYALDHPGTSFRAALNAIQQTEDGAAMLTAYNENAIAPEAQPPTRARDRRDRIVEASVELDERARTYATENPKATYRDAVQTVLREDPELAQRWARGS